MPLLQPPQVPILGRRTKLGVSLSKTSAETVPVGFALFFLPHNPHDTVGKKVWWAQPTPMPGFPPLRE